MYKNLCNLIEEASRLDKELKKMSPEKQMETLRKLNAANLETFDYHIPGITPDDLINLRLHSSPNSKNYSKSYDTLRDLNVLDFEHPNLINKNNIADDFRTNLRKFTQAQNEYYNRIYNKPLNQLKTRENIHDYRNRLKFTEFKNKNKNNKTSTFFDKNQNFGIINGGSYTKTLLDLYGNRDKKLKGVYSDRNYLNSKGLWVHQVPVDKNTDLNDFIKSVKNNKESPLGYSYSYANRKAYDYLDKPAVVYGITNGDNVLKTSNPREAFVPNDKYQNGKYKIELVDPEYRLDFLQNLSNIGLLSDKENGLMNQERYLNDKGRQKLSEIQAEEEAKKQAALEAQRQTDVEAQRQAEEEAQRKAALEAEAQRKAEEEAQKQAALEAQRKAEEEAKKQAALEAQKQAEAERRAQAEAQKQAALEAQRKAEEEAKRKAEAQAQLEKQMARAEAERRKQTTLRHAKERHEQRRFYEPYLVKSKRYFRTHPNAKYAAAGLGGLGAAGLGYGMFNDDAPETPETPDHIHELLGAL